jgi:hypothetical protein
MFFSSFFLFYSEWPLFGSGRSLSYPRQPRTENIQYTGQWCANSAMASLLLSRPAATHEPQLAHCDSMSALFAAMTKCMNWSGDMGRAYFLSGMKDCSILHSHLFGELTK